MEENWEDVADNWGEDREHKGKRTEEDVAYAEDYFRDDESWSIRVAETRGRRSPWLGARPRCAVVRC